MFIVVVRIIQSGARVGHKLWMMLDYAKSDDERNRMSAYFDEETLSLR